MKFCKKLDATEYLSDWSEEKNFSEKKIPTFFGGKIFYFEKNFFTKLKSAVKIALAKQHSGF